MKLLYWCLSFFVPLPQRKRALILVRLDGERKVYRWLMAVIRADMSCPQEKVVVIGTDVPWLMSIIMTGMKMRDSVSERLRASRLAQRSGNVTFIYVNPKSGVLRQIIQSGGFDEVVSYENI